MGNQQRKGGSARTNKNTNPNAKPRDPNPGPVVKSPQAQRTSTQNMRAERADAIKSSRVAAKQRYERNKREMQIIRIGGAAIAIVLVALIGFGIYRYADDQANDDPPEKTVANFSNTGGHVEGTVQYAQNPPAGGEHNARWQNCGFYSAELVNEYAVHSQEHGAVWITYQPDLPQDQIDELKNIADSQDYILVSPYPGLPSPVVASSWNHQIQLTGADDPDLMRFISTYKQGPDTPEPGASCSGNISTTK